MRAELVNRLAAARAAAGRGGLLRPRRPRAADGRRRGGGRRDRAARRAPSYSGLVLNERGYERFARPGSTASTCTLGATESFNQRNGERVARRGGRAGRARSSRRRPCAGDGHDLASPSAARSRAGSTRAAVADARASGFDGAEVVLADTIGVATPRAGARARRARTRRGRLPRAQHAQHRLRERARRARGGRDACSTRRSAASAAARTRRARPATSRPRTSSTCSSARAIETGRRPRRADRDLDVAGGRCSAGSSRARSTAPAPGRPEPREGLDRERRSPRRRSASSRPRRGSPCARPRSCRSARPGRSSCTRREHLVGRARPTSKRKSTWLSTTSLRTSAPGELDDRARRSARACVAAALDELGDARRGRASAAPRRRRTPRARRENSGTQSIWSRTRARPRPGRGTSARRWSSPRGAPRGARQNDDARSRRAR